MAGDRVVLVDGSALVYRAFFAIPPHLKTKDGRHTNATFGFAQMFHKLFSGRRPARGAVVFDAPGRTFRDEQYPEYKAQRAPMPDDLRDQLRDIDEVVRVARFPALRVPGFEADDVIGTLARQAEARGDDVVIVSSDKDFAQLVGERVRMHDTLKDVHYDRALVKKKWGVWPEQIVDWLALVGDAVDNIPGVAGIGDKGAQQLLEEHGSLDGILRALAESPDALPARARKALAAGVDSAQLSRSLATIDTAAPLPVTLDDLVVGDIDVAERNALYARLEFFSLLARIAPPAAATTAATTALIEPDTAAGNDAREVAVGAPATTMTTPAAIAATPDDVAALLGRLPAGAPVAVWAAIDGRDDDDASAISGALVGLALCAGAGAGDEVFAAWVPCADANVRAALRPWLGDALRSKVLHEAKALRVLLALEGAALEGVVFDTQLASFLVDPTAVLPHTLEGCARHWLHEALPGTKELTGGGRERQRLTDIEVGVVAGFAVERARAVARLHELLAGRVVDAGQQRTLTEVDLPLSKVLGDMERVGVALDRAVLGSIGEELRERLASLTAEVHGHAGHAFNIASTKQLGAVLFEELKLPVVKKTKTGWSTDAEVLERLSGAHPIAAALLQHRKLDKLLHTYVDVLGAAAAAAPDGRIHATFQQTTGATGRLITTAPDLQRTPVKTDEGARIRRAFVAAPGYRIVDADWSQIELRLLAHVTGDPLLVEAFRTGQDLHRQTAALLFAKDAADVDKRERDVGKTVNFATLYGQGASALSAQLHVDKKTAQRFIDAFFAGYEGVARYVDDAVARARERGYAETLLGRRRVIPELSSKSPMDRSFGERVAVNTPIQGSAADVCKVAMLRIARRLSAEVPAARMLLQIHDELVLEAPADDVERVCAIVKHEMERTDVLGVTVAVPLVAEVGVGASWGDAK